MLCISLLPSRLDPRYPERQGCRSMMPKSRLIASLIIFLVGVGFSQTPSDSSSQSTTEDCSDASRASSPECIAAQAQRAGSARGLDVSSPSVSPPVLRALPELNLDQ